MLLTLSEREIQLLVIHFIYRIGIKAKNGVVIVVEKKLTSILVDEASVKKISVISDNIGATYAGLGPDFRILS